MVRTDMVPRTVTTVQRETVQAGTAQARHNTQAHSHQDRGRGRSEGTDPKNLQAGSPDAGREGQD